LSTIFNNYRLVYNNIDCPNIKQNTDINKSEPPMSIKSERQEQILDIIRQYNRITLAKISENFSVSEITIRRDVKMLEDLGIVRRAHGGVVYYIEADNQAPVVRRQQINASAKQQIAKQAAARVNDGDSIFLGSGSTASYVAQYLKKHDRLTVTTNAVTVIQELATIDTINLIVLGGLLRSSELSMIGHITEQALHEVRVDKVMVGMRGIDITAGLTSDYLPEVMTDRAIMGMSGKVVVLADSTKLGHIASAYVAPIERMTTLITDSKADQDFITQLEAKEIEVILA
jgi:DeoR family transcriptional regulator, aga operon transcriptional repressor